MIVFIGRNSLSPDVKIAEDVSPKSLQMHVFFNNTPWNKDACYSMVVLASQGPGIYSNS